MSGIKRIINEKLLIDLIIIGFGYGIIISLVLSFMNILNNNFLRSYLSDLSDMSSRNFTYFLSVIIICLIGPFIEEFVFRGLVIKLLRRFLPFLWVNLLQAAIFGIQHFNIIQMIYAFLAGLILGYIYNKHQTLYAPIIAHICMNISGYILPQLLSISIFHKVDNKIYIYFIDFIILFLSTFLFYRSFKIVMKRDIL
jgi:membrane protease YdiL (CAAX protease family)